MLDFMRKNANSWIMIVIFAIIIFVFAINFGPWAGNTSQTVPYAAVVNNQPISMAEFQTAYRNQMFRMKQFRPEYDQSQAEKDGLKKIIIDQLISRELLTQLGKDNGLTIEAKTLAMEIKDRVFGPDDKFDKEEYKRRVNAYFQAPVSQFEKQVANEIISEQMNEIIGSVLFVSDNEARKTYLDRNTKAAIDFVKVDPKYFSAKKRFSVDQLKDFQEQNSLKISEYYNNHISDYIKEEEIKASHILIKTEINMTDSEKAKKRQLAEDILTRVKQGEDFSTIAKKESEDQGSKTNGGDLGYFSRGKMVEEFSDAAFALEKNQVSEVVKSPFGFHIIKVVDKRAASEQRLEDVSKEIAKKLMAENDQQEQAKALAQKALEQLKKGLTLDKLALGTNNKTNNKMFAPVIDSSNDFTPITSYISKIGKSKEILSKTFKLEKVGQTAESVIESEGNFFAIRLKSKKDADMKKFAEDKDSIKSTLMFSKKRSFVQQYLKSLKDKAKIVYNDSLLSTNTY